MWFAHGADETFSTGNIITKDTKEKTHRNHEYQWGRSNPSLATRQACSGWRIRKRMSDDHHSRSRSITLVKWEETKDQMEFWNDRIGSHEMNFYDESEYDEPIWRDHMWNEFVFGGDTTPFMQRLFEVYFTEGHVFVFDGSNGQGRVTETRKRMGSHGCIVRRTQERFMLRHASVTGLFRSVQRFPRFIQASWVVLARLVLFHVVIVIFLFFLFLLVFFFSVLFLMFFFSSFVFWFFEPWTHGTLNISIFNRISCGAPRDVFTQTRIVLIAPPTCFLSNFWYQRLGTNGFGLSRILFGRKRDCSKWDGLE